MWTYFPIIFALILYDIKADVYCPSLCVCKNARQTDGSSGTTEASELLKLRCGGSENPITELKEISLVKISNIVINLNLSGNGISTLSRDLHLSVLQKLDLSKNQISLIESDAFYNLTSLQRLDLSGNLIHTVYKEIFKGLINLERLILSQNKIVVLAVGTFEYLTALKQIDISGNPLKCDCDLLWLGDWSRDTNVKLMANPKCLSPESLAGQLVRKLKVYLDLSACSDALGLPLNALYLRPEIGQVVFSGDMLSLRCRAPFTPLNVNYELKWIHPETVTNSSELKTTNIDVMDEGFAETTVTIPEIEDQHMGNWTCSYTKENSSTINEIIEIIVISQLTKYCPPSETMNNRGLLSWPQALRGRSVAQSCSSGGQELATRICSENGTWVDLNTTTCPYISETTKMLQQFAMLNISVSKGTALAATYRLGSLIQQAATGEGLNDADDVNFISKAIRNYMQYMKEEKDLGWALLDIVSSIMKLPHSLMLEAEKQYEACTSVVRAVEDISQYTSNVQGYKTNMAVERFPLRRETFTGVTCVWYSTPGPDGTLDLSRKMLHCSTTNRTISPLLGGEKVIHATIQIPPTLLYRLDHTDLTLSSINKVYNLVVAMYENSALFPVFPEDEARQQVHRSKDYYGFSTKRDDMNLEITSPVVGVKLVNATLAQPLAEPVYIMFRDTGMSSGTNGRAVIWDEANRTWKQTSDHGCNVSHIIPEMVVIRCYRLGYVGLLQNVETGIYGGRTAGARFKCSHPAIYVGSLILIVCLTCAILTYILCYSAIVMARRAKHSLINMWIAIFSLCFMYTFGIYQTEDVRLCQVIGLFIHFFSLSCLLWMVVFASNMYKFVSKGHSQNVDSPEDEIAPDVPIQKPILGLYLVGWGIALIVCGISGAVNLRDYASYAQCFLSTAPSLSAIFVPAIILLVFLMIFYLLIRCTIRSVNGQLSEGTQATENVDLEMWEPNLLSQETNDRRSEEKSMAESDAEDIEHTPIVQLRAQVIVLSIYVSLWTCGCIAIYKPFPAYLPYQEDIFSILYALCATVLGTFILFFYGIARSDVRSQWLLMQCYLKNSKQCCRNRSIFDTNAQTAPANQMTSTNHQVANDNRSRSNSQNSNRTNSKTNNSGNFKVGAELNGQTLHSDQKNGNKISNINLVVLHRQQYRSNNSVTTHPENDTRAAEIFYNPNQSNVARKFFKKQKQSLKRNYLDIPNRRDCETDSQMSLPVVYNGMANIINSGSKVNNTNLHVEKCQQSDTGFKETRHVGNPNILEEENDLNNDFKYKSYSVDKNNSWQTNKQMDSVKSDNRSPVIMNIYTNVPETVMPEHQVISPGSPCRGKKPIGHRTSMSEECLQSHASGHDKMPEMRTISQQCSLEYSSASEVMPLNHTCSDQTINTHSELTSLQETQSALCSTNEITSDTESFGHYIDYIQPSRNNVTEKQENVKACSSTNLNKALQDISEECTSNFDEINDLDGANCDIENADLIEIEELFDDKHNDDDDNADNDMHADGSLAAEKKNYICKNYNFETSSINTSEQGFENESDIYYPNYQVSEVSIRSHGLYAPSPASMCPNELSISFSTEDVSNAESQYVNFDPGWRKSRSLSGHHNSKPAVSCPDVNRDGCSPVSFMSELDELYTQITGRDKDQGTKSANPVLDTTINSDLTLKPHDSDSCVSESLSDIGQIDVKTDTSV